MSKVSNYGSKTMMICGGERRKYLCDILFRLICNLCRFDSFFIDALTKSEYLIFYQIFYFIFFF